MALCPPQSAIIGSLYVTLPYATMRMPHGYTRYCLSISAPCVKTLFSGSSVSSILSRNLHYVPVIVRDCNPKLLYPPSRLLITVKSDFYWLDIRACPFTRCHSTIEEDNVCLGRRAVDVTILSPCLRGWWPTTEGKFPPIRSAFVAFSANACFHLDTGPRSPGVD